MKNILFEMSSQEKNRILEMHKKSTKNHYLAKSKVSGSICSLKNFKEKK